MTDCNDDNDNDTYIDVCKLVNTKQIDRSEMDILFDVDDKINIDYEKYNMYQLQSLKNDAYAILMHVGTCNKKPTILIDEFNYDLSITCKIFSVIYLENELHTLSCNINMIKYQLYKNEKIIGILVVSFNGQFECDNLVSTKYTKQNLNGCFIYTFYSLNNKKIIVKTLKNYPGKKNIIHIGYELLYSLQIKNLLIS